MDVPRRVAVPVVQVRNARRVVAAEAMRVGQAERVALSAHLPARHAVVRLRVPLALVHVRVVVAREADNR